MGVTLEDRIRGSVYAQALGDALGAPFEFAEPDAVEKRTGEKWIDDLHVFEGQVGPHGVWRGGTPAGTGTDDVRYNWLFMELAIELGRVPDGREVARRFLDVFERPGDFFAGYDELARGQFEMWEGVSRGYLGDVSPRYPGVSAEALATRSVGLNYPTMAGLLALPSLGLLFAGDAEGAYRAAYGAAFFDVGYAREATALLAAGQALALEGMEARVLVDELLALDPLCLGGYFGGPFIAEQMPRLLAKARGKQGPELAELLARELRYFSVFDPYRALAIACAALLAHPADPWTALQIAANQGDLDGDGRWRRYADIDCYAGIAGALVGAQWGIGALPAARVEQVLAANRAVYGCDLEQTVARFAVLTRD